MEEEIEKKIKDLKEFIKQKTDQGTANYLGNEIRELCGMVESKALSQHDVSNRRKLLIAFMESLTTEDLTQIEIAEFENVADKFLGN